MSSGQQMLYCTSCERQTIHLKQHGNVFNLVMTVLTCGFWTLQAVDGPGQCTLCGKQAALWQVPANQVTKASPPPIQNII